jgi:glycosyltransferase involved in cell wall biosynthesis
VSIVIPIYNTAAYLGECLDSCLGQTEQSIELLCVNDGSTDDSADILAAFCARDSRIKIINQANQGVSAARNTGIEHAGGEYLFFLDSDDCLVPEALDKLYALAKGTGSQIVVPGGRCFPEANWLEKHLVVRDVTYHNAIDALFHENGSYPFACKLFERDCIERSGVRFNTRLTLGEDSAFVFCVFPYAQRVSYCSDALYQYRVNRGGSAMSGAQASAKDRLDKHLLMIDFVLTYWKEHGYLHGNESDLLQWASRLLANDSFNQAKAVRDELAVSYRGIVDSLGLSSAIRSLEKEARLYTEAVLSAAGLYGKALVILRTEGLSSLLSRIQR